MQTRSVVVWGFLLSSCLHVGVFPAKPHTDPAWPHLTPPNRDILARMCAEPRPGLAQLSGG